MHHGTSFITMEVAAVIDTKRTGEAIVVSAMTQCLAPDLHQMEWVCAGLLHAQEVTGVDFVRWALVPMGFFHHMSALASHIVMHWHFVPNGSGLGHSLQLPK